MSALSKPKVIMLRDHEVGRYVPLCRGQHPPITINYVALSGCNCLLIFMFVIDHLLFRRHIMLYITYN